jgi:hypothetical protein
LLVLWGLAGCGGGGGGSSAPKQQKSATIVFSTVSSAHTAPLEGIQLTTRLPDGASVQDIATALVGRNDTGQIGSKAYSPPAVSFIVSQVSASPIKFGPFAQLECQIAPGFTLNTGSFTIAPGDLQMTGKDSSGTTVNLVSQIPVTLSVTFGF